MACQGEFQLLTTAGFQGVGVGPYYSDDADD